MSETEKAQCPVCGKWFIAGGLGSHMTTHQEKPMEKCPECGKEFVAKDMDHHRRTHEGRRPCPVCGKVFDVRGLGPHMTSHPDGIDLEPKKITAIVSALAKGMRPPAVAERLGVAEDLVLRFGHLYGYPDLGKLATSADRLRDGVAGAAEAALDQLHGIIEEAAGDAVFLKALAASLVPLAGRWQAKFEAQAATRATRMERARLRAQIAELQAKLNALRTTPAGAGASGGDPS